jgi:hypothetical protein
MSSPSEIFPVGTSATVLVLASFAKEHRLISCA